MKTTSTESIVAVRTQRDTIYEKDEYAHHDLDDIKNEIKRHQENYAQSFLEIGRLLLLAKENFGNYGKWQKWVEENVDIPIVKVQRLMKVARKFGNKTPVPYLEFSKMYILTAIPDDEFESFIKSMHFVGGKCKSVKNMTKREIEVVVSNYLKPTKKSREKKQKISNTDSRSDPFKQLERIKISISAFVDLIQEPDNDLGNRNILVAELRELCSNTIQKLPN